MLIKLNSRIGALNILLICVIIFSSCLLNRPIKWKCRFNYLPKEIKYDTLDDVFLFEDLMSYHISGDVIVKPQSFIRFGDVSKELYKRGIFIYGNFNPHSKKYHKFDSDPHFDFSTVYKMMGQIRFDMNQEKQNDSNFSPFYGLYYTKFHLKMEVLYLGKVKQRIPVFFNNEAEQKKYMKRHHGKDYQIYAIPTYLITKVFEWNKINK